MRSLLVAMLLAVATSVAAAPFPDAHDPVPPSWTGKVFRLSQKFPVTPPAPDAQPWLALDPISQPSAYVNALYRYVLEGNIESDWDGGTNKVRPWFHVPWMHFGSRGRDFVRGLTRERTTPRVQPGRDGELGPQQRSCFQNWAVSLFNAPAGYQIGQVWKDSGNPDVFAAVFPEGSVAVKLLFTAATETEVPYIKGALEWDADVHDLPPGDVDCRSEAMRKVQRLRLLQIDLAVKDKRAPVTGWVFATMAYDGNAPGATWADRMAPVGSQWGNDPGLLPSAKPQESWINTAIKTPQHLGYQGRLNGPVDNPRSACMSCHATAQVPARSGMTPPSTAPPTEIARWFRNLPGDVAFDNRSISTDYSLQIAMGIQNFQLWKSQSGGSFAPPPAAAGLSALSTLLETKPANETDQLLKINNDVVYRIGRD